MAEVEYMHICDYAFKAEGGKSCIIGIFSSINAGSFPCTHPHMVLAIQLHGQAHETIAIHVEIERPNGDVLAGIDGKIAAGADGGAFLNVNLMGLKFPEPGRYTVKVLSEARTLATQSFHLRNDPAPGAAPPVPQVTH